MNPIPRSMTRRSALALALAAACSSASAEDLLALNLEQLLEVRIVGASKYEQKQSEVAAAASIITADEIRAFGWRTLDQALASLPGIHITYDRQYTYLGTRGFGLPGDYNTRVLVMINGNRVNDAAFDSGPMGRVFPLDMDLVERIEFIPGPGGAVYGQNAMFGVVNVITRGGGAINGVELAAGAQRPQSLREGRATWGNKFANGVDMVLSASAMRARGEDRFFDFGATGVAGVARGLDGERDQQFFASIAGGTWSSDLVFGNRRKNDPTASFQSSPLVVGQYQGDRFALAQAQYRDSFFVDTVQLQARLFAGQERYTSELNYGSVFSYPATSEWIGAELRTLYTGFVAHKLMLGVELQDNRRIDQAINDLANPANNVLIASPSSRRGIYAQDEWRIGDTLLATLGLRLDHNSATGNKASPRAGLIWQAATATTLKALYGRAHRAPNAFERDYSDGQAQVTNATLRGESIDTFELVADQRVGKNLNLRAAVYQWTMHDLITLGIDPITGLTQYQSGKAVKATGLELSADKTWTWGGRLRGSLSAQDAHYMDGSKLINSPKLLGKINFSTPLPAAGARLGYELQYDGSRRTVAGVDLGGYAVSSLRLSTDRLARGMVIGVGIRNLFDKRYAHPAANSNWQDSLSQDGRSVRLDISQRF